MGRGTVLGGGVVTVGGGRGASHTHLTGVRVGGAPGGGLGGGREVSGASHGVIGVASGGEGVVVVDVVVLSLSGRGWGGGS